MKRIKEKELGPLWSVSWLDFTDEELSMVLSHIAAGGALCCDAHEVDRAAITADRIKREFLGAWAYEHMGCHPCDLDGTTATMVFGVTMTTIVYWFDRLEGAISRGESMQVRL